MRQTHGDAVRGAGSRTDAEEEGVQGGSEPGARVGLAGAAQPALRSPCTVCGTPAWRWRGGGEQQGRLGFGRGAV